jgi:GntR family transcriptional regulator
VAEQLSEAKARRVYLVLRDRILSNAFVMGARLPTENDLARFHRVSRVTVRRALAELARERLIERRRASGTRVIYKPEAGPLTADITGALATRAEMGKRTTIKLLAFEYIPSAGPIGTALGVGVEEKLQRSVRVRSIKGMAFSYLVTHVPAYVGTTYTKAELASGPLLTLLERSGVKIERATQRISAGLATPEITRIVFDSEGRGIEHLQAFYRPDRYSFEMDLERAGTGNARRWSPVATKPKRKMTR